MKAKRSLLFIVLFLFAQFYLAAQDAYVYKMIGKPKSQVVNTYGKPAHTDNSNPSMVCFFYKKNQNSMVFVSDEKSVFQAEANLFYSGETESMKILSKVVQSAIEDGFSSDTLSTSHFKLHKPGIDFSIAFLKDSGASLHKISVKANRKEGE